MRQRVPEDRRVARTRRQLHQALMALVLEKGYEAVTVQEILDRADVGRATFYAHYAGKHELLVAGFEHLRVLLVRQQREALAGKGGVAERALGFSRAMFEHAYEYRKVYRAMVGRRSGSVAQAQLQRVLVDVVSDDLKALVPHGDNPEVPLDALAHAVAGTLVAIVIWWLDHRTGLSAEEVDRIFRRLMLPGVEAALGKSVQGR